jgi:hypothetical protein
VIGPLIALAASAAPAAGPADLPGVWEGTIGTLPVRACFVRTEWNSFGAYYYLSRLRTIPLESDESGTGFSEGGATGSPRWRIESADSAQVTARWSGGGRSLPVRLRRVEGEIGEEGACGSMVFHRPRLAGLGTQTVRATVDGVGYTRMTLNTRERFDVTFETFALDGESAAVRRINAALGEGLGGDPPRWLQCAQDSLGSGPNEGGFTETLTPVMISRRWLSVAAHWDGFCGGAHPDSSNSWRLFDLTNGGEVEILTWFNTAGVKRARLEQVNEEIRTVEPALRTAILAGWRPEDAECGETIRSTEFWNIGLNRDSLTFSPSLPHVVQACGEDFEIPFARLQPFLTPEGAANLRALQGE